MSIRRWGSLQLILRALHAVPVVSVERRVDHSRQRDERQAAGDELLPVEVVRDLVPHVDDGARLPQRDGDPRHAVRPRQPQRVAHHRQHQPQPRVARVLRPHADRQAAAQHVGLLLPQRDGVPAHPVVARARG